MEDMGKKQGAGTGLAAKTTYEGWDHAALSFEFQKDRLGIRGIERVVLGKQDQHVGTSYTDRRTISRNWANSASEVLPDPSAMLWVTLRVAARGCSAKRY